MLEHEGTGQPGTIATRTDADLMQIGSEAIASTVRLNRSFLLKKMEIEFCREPDSITAEASYFGGGYTEYLVFQCDSAGSDVDTVAECYDASLEDKAKHDPIIWTRIYNWTSTLADTTNHTFVAGRIACFKTQKSFPKGYPLDKDHTYQWKIFNATAYTSPDAKWYLRVRYWGVYL